MNREFRRLDGEHFDLLVIGGGIYGAWTALDASLRGLKVALVERDDWASGTSSACSKLIHGGLRYLERGHVGLVRKSLAERRLLSRLAPHRVSPLRFVLPIYRNSRVGRARMKIGLWLYDRLAGHDQPVAGHDSLSREQLSGAYGFLEPAGLSGGFTYGDCRMDDARFVVELVDGAVSAGAVCINRACARELMLDDRRVGGACVEDLETGERLAVRAAMTAACAGAWTEALVRAARPVRERFAMYSQGVHLVMPGLPSDDGVLLLTRNDQRVVFLIPWYGRTLLGTTDTYFSAPADDCEVSEDDVDYLLAQANTALAGSGWTRTDVIGSFVGLRTFPPTGKRSPSAVSREIAVEEPLPGLVTPIGGKFTSARVDAAGVVDRVMRRLKRNGGCATGERPFPWTPDGAYEHWTVETRAVGLSLGLDRATVDCVQSRYGRNVSRLFALIDESRNLAQRIVPDAPFCWAEVLYAARYEMARGLRDILRRRIPLTLVARPDGAVLAQAAALAGAELGWDERRGQSEIESVTRGYLSPTSIHEPA